MTLFRNSMRFQLREPGPAAAAAAVVPEQPDEDVAPRADTEDSNDGAVNTDAPASGDADAADAAGQPAAEQEATGVQIIAQEPVQVAKGKKRPARGR